MNEKLVKIEVRNVYGNTYYYPANENAKLFTNIAGTKTIDPNNFKYIRLLGFKIEPVQPKIAALEETVQ